MTLDGLQRVSVKVHVWYTRVECAWKYMYDVRTSIHITRFYTYSQLCLQAFACGVWFNLKFQSRFHWSLCNGTWSKRPRELNHRCRLGIEEMTLLMQSAGLYIFSSKNTGSLQLLVYCNTLQHTATHCNTLQYTAKHYNTLQHTATHCNTLQQTTTHCANTLQHTAEDCSTLRHTAPRCNTLQRTATHCSTLQHTATRAAAPDSPCACVQVQVWCVCVHVSVSVYLCSWACVVDVCRIS